MGNMPVTNALVVSIALAVAAAGPDRGSAPTPPTTPDFERDVAPLLARCCQRCHRPDGPGAYPLETAAQVKRIARTLLSAIESRTMPPWSPTDGVVRAPARPSDAEIARIRAWIDAGAPVDDATLHAVFAPRSEPEERILAQWRIGDGWVIGATESRVMRSFQCVPELDHDILVGGWRTVADSPGLVSLALVASGDAALARALDERDASVGFKFTGDLGMRPAASLAGVGIDGRFALPAGFAMRIRKGDALTFEMHADGRGKDESGACAFEALAPSRAGGASEPRLVEPLVVGAQGASRQSADGARVAFAMPPIERSLDLVAITIRPGPYGKTALLTAQDPGRDHAPMVLLRIDRYDTHLDRTYVVDPPVRLPRGTVLALDVAAENETLAQRSTPQAVLLVAPTDQPREVSSNDAAQPQRPSGRESIGPRAREFIGERATVVAQAGHVRATALASAELFTEVMGYEPEPRTGATDSAGMSWFEAIELANRLSERAGLRNAYAIEFPQREGPRLVGGVVTATGGDGWRLPDQDEWIATFESHPELSGTLWNWTSEREGDARVVRGGCWADNPGTQGKRARSSVPPATRSELFGVRFVRNLVDRAPR